MKKKPRTRQYERKQKVSLEELLPQIGNLPRKRDNEPRMLLFTHGTTCECCGLKGTHFWLERSGYFAWHYNLYGVDDLGREIMLTQDHIIPRSKGGPDDLDNLQLLCEPCNILKKDKIISIEELRILRTQPKIKKNTPRFLSRKKLRKLKKTNQHELYFQSRPWPFLITNHKLKFLYNPPIYLGNFGVRQD